jgi:hypothetical protein
VLLFIVLHVGYLCVFIGVGIVSKLLHSLRAAKRGCIFKLGFFFFFFGKLMDSGHHYYCNDQ